MKSRPKGFLSDKTIDHDSEPFGYIAELHDYLWRFIRVINPSASGRINDFLDDTIEKAERIIICQGKISFPLGSQQAKIANITEMPHA